MTEQLSSPLSKTSQMWNEYTHNAGDIVHGTQEENSTINE